jgi:hypothetical protein
MIAAGCQAVHLIMAGIVRGHRSHGFPRRCVMVIVAPGIIAPVGSAMCPRKLAVVTGVAGAAVPWWSQKALPAWQELAPAPRQYA